MSSAQLVVSVLLLCIGLASGLMLPHFHWRTLFVSSVGQSPTQHKPPVTWNNISQFSWCGKRPWVSLTFDDAWEHPQLDDLLHDLHRFQVPATFMVVPGNDPKFCSEARKVIAQGHTIQSHTLTHPHLLDLNASERRHEIKGVEDIVYGRCGFPRGMLTQLRPPYFSFNHSLAEETNALGYSIAMANANNFDWNGTSLEQTWKDVSSTFESMPTNSSFLIVHHNWAYRANGTKGIIAKYVDYFRPRGYRFVSSRECFAACVADNDCVSPGAFAF